MIAGSDTELRLTIDCVGGRGEGERESGHSTVGSVWLVGGKGNPGAVSSIQRKQLVHIQ